jgi:site-specific recombinase XerD
VFQGPDGGPRKYRVDGINAAITRAGLNDAHRTAETGEKITAHNLRHTHASRLVMSGMSLYKVGQLLGHTNLETTAKYSHLVNDDISREAVEILDRIGSELE